MIVSQGYWNELAEQCKQCANIHVMSLHMDGKHYYACGKYPLTDNNMICPRFIAHEERDEDNVRN